jgi:NAD(P)-dependent dehydrogenase (short-subunit alcohol dehydrogenase family)
MSVTRILVLGGGFAGLWSAVGAARKLDELGRGADAVEVTGFSDYAVAKGGLVTLTYYLASEYGNEHIRAFASSHCNMLSPLCSPSGERPARASGGEGRRAFGATRLPTVLRKEDNMTLRNRRAGQSAGIVATRR